MSLVVAKKKGNHIYIVSDTCLDNPDNLNKIELFAPAEYSLIKTLIINPFIAVSFAGETDPLKEAIPVCRKLNYHIDDIVKYLLSVNISSGNKTEFIVCITLPPYVIYEIKNSAVNDRTESAWIGSVDGFNEFQKHFLEPAHGKNKMDFTYDFEQAMVGVIESPVAGVNGFMISVSNEQSIFQYKNFVRTYIVPKTYEGGGLNVIGFGTVQEGGYTIHILPAKPDVLAIHIPQNRYGIIYSIKNNCLLEPEAFKDVDEHEFSEITNERHGIKPDYRLSSLQKSYLERGNKSAGKREFEKAIHFYDAGLMANDDGMKADLYFNKGVCYYHLSKSLHSTAAFNEAIKLRSSMQPKVFQFLTKYRKK